MRLSWRIGSLAILCLFWGTILFLLNRSSQVNKTTEWKEWPAFIQEEMAGVIPQADAFDWPLRPPDAQGATCTQGFMQAQSLGESWTVGKGDEALGEPVCAAANGWVALAINLESYWGYVVIIIHQIKTETGPEFVESFYSRLRSVDVKVGDIVKRGQKLGEMGNTDLAGEAYLYFEIRNKLGLQLGAVEGSENGWVSPSDFIRQHRPSLH